MINENDPAFTGPTDKGYTPGLTKLEYFAAMAMQGHCANYTYGRSNDGDAEFIAKKAVCFAKALINELNKQS